MNGNQPPFGSMNDSSQAQKPLVSYLVLTYAVFLLFSISMTCSLALFVFLFLSAYPIFWVEDMLGIYEIRTHVWVFFLALLVLLAFWQRQRVQYLSDREFRRTRSLSAWILNAAWVNGWMFTALVVANLLCSSLVSGSFPTIEGSGYNLRVFIESYLIGLDMVLSSIFFDFMEVLELGFSTIEPSGKWAKGIAATFKMLITVTFVRSVFELVTYAHNGRISIDHSEFGFLGTMTFILVALPFVAFFSS